MAQGQRRDLPFVHTQQACLELVFLPLQQQSVALLHAPPAVARTQQPVASAEVLHHAQPSFPQRHHSRASRQVHQQPQTVAIDEGRHYHRVARHLQVAVAEAVVVRGAIDDVAVDNHPHISRHRIARVGILHRHRRRLGSSQLRQADPAHQRGLHYVVGLARTAQPPYARHHQPPTRGAVDEPRALAPLAVIHGIYSIVGILVHKVARLGALAPLHRRRVEPVVLLNPGAVVVIEEGVVTYKEVVRVVHTRLNRHRRQRISSAAAVHHGHHRPSPRKTGVIEGAIVAPMVFRRLLPLHMGMRPQPRLQVEHHGILVHQQVFILLVVFDCHVSVAPHQPFALLLRLGMARGQIRRHRSPAQLVAIVFKATESPVGKTIESKLMGRDMHGADTMCAFVDAIVGPLAVAVVDIFIVAVDAIALAIAQPREIGVVRSVPGPGGHGAQTGLQFRRGAVGLQPPPRAGKSQLVDHTVVVEPGQRVHVVLDVHHAQAPVAHIDQTPMVQVLLERQQQPLPVHETAVAAIPAKGPQLLAQPRRAHHAAFLEVHQRRLILQCHQHLQLASGHESAADKRVVGVVLHKP